MGIFNETMGAWFLFSLEITAIWCLGGQFLLLKLAPRSLARYPYLTFTTVLASLLACLVGALFAPSIGRVWADALAQNRSWKTTAVFAGIAILTILLKHYLFTCMVEVAGLLIVQCIFSIAICWWVDLSFDLSPYLGAYFLVTFFFCAYRAATLTMEIRAENKMVMEQLSYVWDQYHQVNN